MFVNCIQLYMLKGWTPLNSPLNIYIFYTKKKRTLQRSKYILFTLHCDMAMTEKTTLHKQYKQRRVWNYTYFLINYFLLLINIIAKYCNIKKHFYFFLKRIIKIQRRSQTRHYSIHKKNISFLECKMHGRLIK